MATSFTNPAFSEPALDPADAVLTVTGPDQDAIPGWQVTTGEVQVVPLDTDQRPTGDGRVTQAVRLKESGNPRSTGEISQDVSTKPGARITLTWYESPDIDSPPRSATNEQSYRVSAQPTDDGAGPVVFYPGDDVAGPKWKARSLEFTAAAETTTIEFRTLIEGMQGPLITGLAIDDGTGLGDDTPHPSPTATDLVVSQPAPVTAAPGRTAKLSVQITAPSDDPVVKDGLEQVFTAPTGLVFTGVASYSHSFGVGPHPAGHLDVTLGDGGRSITVHNPITLNTTPRMGPAVTYTFQLKALADAAPGSHADGTAAIGTQSIPLKVTVARKHG